MRRTGKIILNELATALSQSIDELTNNDLRLLKKRCKGLTNGNCWWVSFGIGKTVGEMVDNTQRHRRQQKRKAAKA